jgi:SAM-dependent methyltransferase
LNSLPVRAEQLVDIDTLDAFYDERYEGEYMASHGDQEVWRTLDVLRAAQLPPAPDVVDYGCGRGAWVPILRRAFPGCSVVGVEISSKAVADARRAHPDSEFHVFDGHQAPLPDACADLVFSYHVIEHVVDLDESIGDMVRLVRPGGYACAILPCGNRGSVEELATRLVTDGLEFSGTGERRFFYEDPSHLRRLTSSELTARFNSHGCELVEAFFSRHLAAVDYLAGSSGVVRQVFDPTRAKSRGAAVALSALRAAYFSVAALKKASHTPREDLVGMAKRGAPARRVTAAGALAARPIAALALRAIEDELPRREWQRSAREPRGGAAQFLLFRKR